ncbi:MAG TPA: SigB/SigF/SigG family RNA polymerase sigma factor [Solirubrobacteraceae bacterium]
MSQGLSHLPVCREPSEAELFRSWHQGRDERAREELVSRYLPLTRSLARRYSGAREPLEDLLQVASLGLIKAIDRFDATRGLRFSSFAVPTILGELKRYFRDTGWAVHVPRSAQEHALELQQVQERLTSRSGRPPTVGELAEFMELSVDQVLERLEAAAAHHAASLDAPLEADEEEAGSIIDVLAGEESGYRQVEDGLTISAVAEQLSRRDLMALELRFRRDLTQSEIAERLGISQMQVSRILRRALDSMRERASYPA